MHYLRDLLKGGRRMHQLTLKLAVAVDDVPGLRLHLLCGILL